MPFSSPAPIPLWLQILLVVAWVGGVTLLAETLSRRQIIEPETVRKVVHVGTGNVILLAWWCQTPGWVAIAASILFGGVTLLSYKFPILPGINSVGRKSLGTFFYAVSIGVLVALFWQSEPRYAVLGIMAMTWGDGLAALIGKTYGKHLYTISTIQKSWEGSLTMAVVTYGISLWVLLATQGWSWQTGLVPLAVAIAATLLEAFSRLGVDNLTVPLGSAAIAFLLNEFWLS